MLYYYFAGDLGMRQLIFGLFAASCNSRVKFGVLLIYGQCAFV